MPFAGFDRRRLLATPAVLGLAALARAAQARAPILGTQVPPWHRRRLGAFEVTVVSDGVMGLQPDFYGAGIAGPGEVPALLAESRLDPATISGETNCLVVNTGRELVLIDTGNGPTRAFGPATGRLPENLRSAGIDPADIDVVAITHIHPDHAWGVVQADGSPTFPNARYAMPGIDFDFFTAESRLSAPAPLGGFIAGTRATVLPLAPRTTMLSPGQEIVPGLRTFASAGHSPGHLAIHVESEGQRLLVLGDVATHPVIALQRPEWPLRFDADPAGAVVTRRRMLGMAATDRVEIASYHFPWPGLGQVETAGNAFRYLPTPWRWG